ncbi:MAG: 1-phosphofructokinase [Ruminococcus sp.]|nr:1-phosphofructokinase [Ruminococcus sp.]MBR4622819.1 1-phosphofructokinase [Ruminococcus sp.]
MVYTVTFNPAIDYVMHTERVKLGEVNRSVREEIYFGGKGINVSAVLKELGVASKALGFVAGFTGEAIAAGLTDMGIDSEMIRLEKGSSRINVKLKGKEETELNGRGPEIDQSALEKLFAQLDRLESGDTLVLAGSIPASLPEDIYEQILARLSGKGIRAAVDATGKLLLNVLRYEPFVIKPNTDELGELFGQKPKTDEEIIACAKELQSKGAQNVLVSMAGDGALLLDEKGKIHRCGVCKGEVKNSVGAGDSMLAGFLAGCLSGQDYTQALKLGTAAGGATAFSEGLGKKETIMRLLKEI